MATFSSLVVLMLQNLIVVVSCMACRRAIMKLSEVADEHAQLSERNNC